MPFAAHGGADREVLFERADIATAIEAPQLIELMLIGSAIVLTMTRMPFRTRTFERTVNR